MGDVALVTGGTRYKAWTGIRVTRSIESLTGSFALELADKWDITHVPPVIYEGDACRVEVNGQVVIDGYITELDLGRTPKEHTLGCSGNDRAIDLVESSLLIEDTSTKGNKWTYRNVDLEHFAKAIAAPHGVSVSVQPGLVLNKDPLLVAHPGETCFEALQRAARSAGVLIVSDGAGGIVITRAGVERVTPLTEGGNLMEVSAKYSTSNRFNRYLVSSQPPGTDSAYGDACRVQAEAVDLDVTRTNRTLLIRPDKGLSAADARRRANWEALIRAAKSAAITGVVQGWTRPGIGKLWTINTITRVKAPSVRVDGDMLISQVEYTKGSGGEITKLTLVRPDAFTPEPQTTAAAATVSGEGLWKELKNGGK